MNITPLNMQMVIPQSTEVGSVQQNIQNAVNAQQNFELLQQKADAELAQKQVRAKDEVEEGRIKYDPDHQKRQGGGGFFGGSRQEKKSEDESADKMAADPHRGRLLDISL